MPEDLDLLQGEWSVSALEVEGKKMPAAMLENAQIVINGNRFTSTGMGAVYKGTLQLDTSVNPRQLDMKFDAGPEKGNTNVGIYKLTGDTWKLCLATQGTVRPSRFAATPGSGFAFETLTRGARPAAKTMSAPARKAEPSKAKGAPATEFEGEWQMVSGVMSGKAMKQSDVQWVRRVTSGNETSVIAGPQVLMKILFTRDASKTPRTIDYDNVAGANKGKTQQGIYEFDGDLLRVCVGAPGAPRPAEFQSLAGDGRSFTIWKRL